MIETPRSSSHSLRVFVERFPVEVTSREESTRKFPVKLDSMPIIKSTFESRNRRISHVYAYEEKDEGSSATDKNMRKISSTSIITMKSVRARRAIQADVPSAKAVPELQDSEDNFTPKTVVSKVNLPSPMHETEHQRSFSLPRIDSARKTSQNTSFVQSRVSKSDSKSQRQTQRRQTNVS